jgi:hypothetical protein
MHIVPLCVEWIGRNYFFSSKPLVHFTKSSYNRFSVKKNGLVELLDSVRKLLLNLFETWSVGVGEWKSI